MIKKNYKYASFNSTSSIGNKYNIAFKFIVDNKTVMNHTNIMNFFGYIIKCLEIKIKINTKIATLPKGHILNSL